MLETFIQLIRGALESMAQMRMPHEIMVEHPEGSPLAGVDAGRFLLSRSGGGCAYTFHANPEAKIREAVSELTIAHSFDDLGDMMRFLEAYAGEEIHPVVFVKAPQKLEALIEAIDYMLPQAGSVKMAVQRHPAWKRWFSGIGEHRDMTHHDLVDLVLDNREDLEQPELADHLSRFRAVREVHYDADLGSSGHEGVRVTYKGSGGQKGAKGDIAIPREFVASFPAFTGPWAPGEEPKQKAIFRLRVLPPRDEGAAPLFRLMWVNLADYELEASYRLVGRVREVMGERPVYAGTPSSCRVILPAS